MTTTAPADLEVGDLLPGGTHLIGGEWAAAASGETIDVINPATREVEGAEVVTGGHKLSGGKFDTGFFVEPTIFDRVDPGMRIAQEEIFGPVLSVIGYEDEEEALAIANGTKYGLVASIWTDDVNRAVRLARGVQAGSVYINGFGSRGVIGAPFGGYKYSGFGRTMSADSILDYTQLKTIVFNGTS